MEFLSHIFYGVTNSETFFISYFLTVELPGYTFLVQYIFFNVRDVRTFFVDLIYKESVG